MRLEARLPGAAYPILIGRGALAELAGCLPSGRGLVVTDQSVGALWAGVVTQQLSREGRPTPLLELPAGEDAKSFRELERVCAALEEAEVRRDGWVLALGGGTVGDVAGLAAGLWQRGVALIQVPTTLLAMVDSSLGGKTGINTAGQKNAVGTLHQPRAVVADLACLDTLPEPVYRSAFGEIVKYGMALDGALAQALAASAGALRGRDPDALETVVARCAELKCAVVAEDVRDTGRRAVLNYGHTVGHALETASGYRLAHGLAVGSGMRVAAEISARLQLCPPEVPRLQAELLDQFGLPPVENVEVDRVLDLTRRDKKVEAEEVRWVLLREVGQAEPGHRVDGELVRAVLQEVLG